MIKKSVHTTLQHAVSLLRIATTELNRPEEDVVALSACECTRNSLIEFLHSYLVEKNHPKNFLVSPENLLKECCKIDSSFGCIDISCFSCKTLDKDCIGEYCLDVKKVHECFERAKVVKELVLAKLKVNPAGLE